MSLDHHEHPTLRSVFMLAEAYVQVPWPGLNTMGFVGHWLVQPRREIPTAIRRGQDGGRAGGREPGSFRSREILVEI